MSFGAISALMVARRAGLPFPEFVAHLAVVLLGWFALFFVLTFALAYAFPPPGTRFEFPGAGKVVWLLLGLLFLVTAALVWMADSSQMP